MKIKCINGFFIFEPQTLTQLSDFIYLTGFNIVRFKDYYTFKILSELPNFSIKDLSFSNLTAKTTSEGEPWDLLDRNGFVYDFTLNQLRLFDSVTQVVDLRQAQSYFLSNGLIQPGALTIGGSKIKSYECFFSRTVNSFKYSEVVFV